MTTQSGSRVAPRYVLIALLAAPFAWLVQMMIAETVAAQTCYPYNHPLGTPIVWWMHPLLIGVSVLCLLAGAFGSWVAVRNLRRIAPLKRGALFGERRTRAELDGFLVHVAAMSSGLFLFALIATDIAVALVSPCRWW
ncbi:hypothetical protein LJ656_26615 [Paraburkholderia sp. MMS20-SJTR3]|uniref:Cytochrome C oxidase subunit I n=1 Tax=Paraburkholderia sejongensis TaxID=2886946 RepID=A0ABS8K1Z0_9BURK|nr:hypothetical protein [Paraburkholderia sp. MMS20-SJTR3]MCC8396166.1 hypothetical protein [Paraburkholderia sp. MMS20-SJTR3]